MIRLSDILQEWKKDSVLDEILLDESSLKIATLHSKYVEYLTSITRQIRRLKAKKRDFPAVERRHSSEFAELEELIEEMNDALDAVDRIIYSINQMSFNIKNIIQWRCFLKGTDI